MTDRGSYRGPAAVGLSRKQLELRRTVIGGTDAAAILGLSPWRGPHDVYAEKAGLVPAEPHDPSEPALWGLLLEPVLRWRYQQQTGRTVRVPRGLRRHVRYRWLAGNLDGEAEDRLVELKTARSAAGWGEPGTDEVPPAYRCQVMHYMAVTDAPRTDIAVLIGGQDYRLYTVERDEEVIRDLVAEEAEFRVDHILPRVPPEPDGSPGAAAMLRLLYPDADPAAEKIAMPGAGWDAITALLLAREAETAAAREAERLKQVVMTVMGEASRLLSPMATISWIQADRRETDWPAFTAYLRETAVALGAVEEELAEARDRFTVTRSVRQFRVQTRGPALVSGQGPALPTLVAPGGDPDVTEG